MGAVHRAAIAALVGCLALPAYGADLAEIFELSMARDPRFQAARYEYEAAREAVPQARALLLPALSLNLEHLETHQDIKSSDNAVFAVGSTDFPTDSYTLTLTQPLFRYADWQRLRQSQAEVAQAFADFSAAEQELMLRAAELYLGVLASQDDLAFAEAEQSAVERQRELARARRASGLAPRTDEYDANARYALVVADTIEAQNQLEDSYQALRESIGEVVTDLEPLAEDIRLQPPDPPDVEAWVDLAEQRNLRLEARRSAVSVAEREVNRQQAGHYPTLEFAARLNNRDTDGSLFGGGSEIETADYSIQLNVPIYQGGATSSRVREARLRYKQVLEELEQEQFAVTRQARSAYLGVIGGISKIEALAESLLAQESALEAKQRGYRSGLYTALDVLDAERDLYLIKRDYAQARYDYLLDTLRLKQVTAALSMEDLRHINDMLAETER